MFIAMKRLFKGVVGISSFTCLCMWCSSSAQELKLPHYSANPQAANFSWVCKKRFPNGKPGKIVSPRELDVRSCDISSWDLTDYTAWELADVITFDSRTKFPARRKLPKGFSVKKILKNGKTPGLDVSTLRARGIAGKGVPLAVIDQNITKSPRICVQYRVL